MKNSAELMREVDRELLLGGAVWFVWGVWNAARNWLSIGQKLDKTDGMVWLGFGCVVVLGFFVAKCAKAVLAAIEELEQDDEEPGDEDS